MRPQTFDWKPSTSHSGTESAAVTSGRVSTRRRWAPSVLRHASSGQTAIRARKTTPSGLANVS